MFTRTLRKILWTQAQQCPYVGCSCPIELYRFVALICSTGGDLYATTATDGAHDAGVVFRFKP